MKLTGAAILVSRGMKVLQAAPAAYPYRSAKRAHRVEDRTEREQRDADRRLAVEGARAAEADGRSTWRSRFLIDLDAQRCPACGSADVAGTMYGLPEFTDELTAELDAGRVFLGGCTMFEDATVWVCRVCADSWGRLFPVAPDAEPLSWPRSQVKTTEE